jgi:hypothetical protein
LGYFCICYFFLCWRCIFLLLTCNASSRALFDSPDFVISSTTISLGHALTINSPAGFALILACSSHSSTAASYSPTLASPPQPRRPMQFSCLTMPPLMLFLSSSPPIDLHSLSLHHYLRSNNPQVLFHRNGRDIFLILSGFAWNYQSPHADSVSLGTSFLRLPKFVNFTIVTLELRPWPWQEHAIPHMTSFHPSSLLRLNDCLICAARLRRTYNSNALCRRWRNTSCCCLTHFPTQY